MTCAVAVKGREYARDERFSQSKKFSCVDLSPYFENMNVSKPISLWQNTLMALCMVFSYNARLASTHIYFSCLIRQLYSSLNKIVRNYNTNASDRSATFIKH